MGARAARGDLPFASLLLLPDAERRRRCAGAAGRGLRLLPSLLCGRAAGVLVSGRGGKHDLGLGAGGRGGPLANAERQLPSVQTF